MVASSLGSGTHALTDHSQMYEAKKDAAIKTIEKKEAKVEEIQKVLPLPRSLSHALTHTYSLAHTYPG